MKQPVRGRRWKAKQPEEAGRAIVHAREATTMEEREGRCRELGILKPTTVQQDFRVLHRILNVAVKKKLISANP